MYRSLLYICRSTFQQQVAFACFLMTLFMLPVLAKAQTETVKKKPTGTVKGIVVDSLSAKGISYMTIAVHDATTEEVLKTVFSNEDGSFEISELPYRRCKLLFSSIAYKSKTVALPSFTSSIIFVGKVPLTSSSHQLQEVTVVAEKLLIQQDADKLVYNVAADPESKNISALELMRKVPLLSVNTDNRVQLSGSSNFRVLINGKTSSLFIRNASDVLRNMPANTIKSIEVITNPPARFEAEGVAGLINIITHKKKVDGYNGAFNVGASSPTGITAGGYITAKTGAFGFSNNSGISADKTPISTSDFIRTDLMQNLLKQTAESKGENKSLYNISEVSFEVTPVDLVSANYSYNSSKGTSNFLQKVQALDRSAVITEAYNNTNTSSTTWRGGDVGIDYQRSFKKNVEKLLTLSYKSTTSNNGGLTQFALIPLYNYNSENNFSENEAVFKEKTYQVDYVHPFSKVVLEVGMKSIARNSSSDYFYNSMKPGTNYYTIDTAFSNSFTYTQKISSGYFSSSYKRNNWSLKTGARVEETLIDARFKSSRTATAQRYFNVIPSVTFSKKFKRSNLLKLSYNQRLERASLYYLDPFVDLSDPKNIYSGNPNLLPAVSNVFNMGYSTYAKGTSLSFNGFYHFTNNAILRYTQLRKDTVAFTTYGNIGKEENIGIAVGSNFTIKKKLNVNIDATFNYLRYGSSSDGLLQTNKGMNCNVFTYVGYRFNNAWRSSASVNYTSASIQLQGSTAGYFSNTVSVTRDFFKDQKGSLNLTISNPFQQTRRSFTEVIDPVFYQLQQSAFVVRNFKLSFNYRFGKLKGDIVRKQRGIKNDDLKTND